jgi:hypothetical protein
VQNSGLLRRLGAILYDTLLVLALMFLVTIPFIAVRGGEPVEAGDNRLYQLCLVLVTFVFFTGFWSYSGKTQAFAFSPLFFPGFLQALVFSGACGTRTS